MKDRRRNLGMSQQQFAKYLGVGSSSVKRWELGWIQDKAMNDLILLRTDPRAAEANLAEVLASAAWKTTWEIKDTPRAHFPDSWACFNNRLVRGCRGTIVEDVRSREVQRIGCGLPQFISACICVHLLRRWESWPAAFRRTNGSRKRRECRVRRAISAGTRCRRDPRTPAGPLRGCGRVRD